MAAILIKQQAIGTYSDYYLRLYIEQTVDQSSNSSTVTVSLRGYTERAQGICSWNGSGTNSISITIDGTTNTLSNQDIDTGYNETGWRASNGKLLHSYTKTITHSSDGTKTISVSGSINYKGGGSSLGPGTYTTGSVNQLLTPIARASTFGTISNTTISNTTGSVTINITKANSNYYDRLETSGIYTTTINFDTATSKTISWSDLLNAMTSVTSGTLTLTLKTYSKSGYNQSDFVGTTSKSITITIKTSSIKPTATFGSIAVNTSPIASQLIAGKSTARIVLTATPSSGATISTNNIRIVGTNCTIDSVSKSDNNYTYITTTLPSNTSKNYNISFTATVTDSRGLVVTNTSTTREVQRYQNPAVTITAYRTSASSGTNPEEDPGGEKVYVKYASAPFSITGNNIVSTTATLTVDNTTSNITNGSYHTVATDKSGKISITVTDTIGGTTTAIKTVGTALIPLDLYSNQAGTNVGVGLGAAAIANRVTTGIPTYLYKDTRVGTADLAESVTLRVMSNSGTIILDSEGNANGNGIRGIWLGPHGSFTAGWLIHKNGSSGQVFIDEKTPVLLTGTESTWSGNITFEQLPKIKTTNTSFPRITFSNSLSNNAECGGWGLWFSGNGNQSQLGARIYSYSSSDYKNLSYREDYWLPPVDADRTANKNYNILTTKSPVAITEGGTGATTLAAAKTNLGISDINQPSAVGPITVSGNSTGTLSITTANYKFYLFKFNCNSIITPIFTTYSALSTSAQTYYIDDGSSTGAPVVLTRTASGVTVKRDGSTSCTVALYYWN